MNQTFMAHYSERSSLRVTLTDWEQSSRCQEAIKNRRTPGTAVANFCKYPFRLKIKNS